MTNPAATRTFPGARRPDRQRRVDTTGISLAVHEWGDESAPPVLLAHGGFDFARTYDVFAPLLADAGWRVVSWDQRGHGDSEHADAVQWDADVRDAARRVRLGHRRPGAGDRPLEGRVADAPARRRRCPHRISPLVNIDGLP